MAAAATAAFSVVEYVPCAFGVFVFELVVLYEEEAKSVCAGGMQPNRHHPIAI